MYTVCPYHNVTQTTLLWGVAQSVLVVGVWMEWEASESAMALVQNFQFGGQCTLPEGSRHRQAQVPSCDSPPPFIPLPRTVTVPSHSSPLLCCCQLHIRCASAESVALQGSPLTFTAPSSSPSPSLPSTPPGYISAVAELQRCAYTIWLYSPAACPALPPSPIPTPFNASLAQSEPFPKPLPSVSAEMLLWDVTALRDCIHTLQLNRSAACGVQWNAVREALASGDERREEEGERGAPYPYRHRTVESEPPGS